MIEKRKHELILYSDKHVVFSEYGKAELFKRFPNVDIEAWKVVSFLVGYGMLKYIIKNDNGLVCDDSTIDWFIVEEIPKIIVTKNKEEQIFSELDRVIIAN